MSKIYFVRSTVLLHDAMEEIFWETGSICFAKEHDVLTCIDKLERIVRSEHKYCRNLITTVGIVNGVTDFSQVDSAKETSIVYNSNKSCIVNITKIIDPDIDFQMFRREVDELIYENGEFTEYRLSDMDYGA